MGPGLALAKPAHRLRQDQFVEALQALVIGRLACTADRVRAGLKPLALALALPSRRSNCWRSSRQACSSVSRANRSAAQAETHGAALLVGANSRTRSICGLSLSIGSAQFRYIGVARGHVQCGIRNPESTRPVCVRVAGPAAGCRSPGGRFRLRRRTFLCPKALDHVEEFAGALVAQVMLQEVAIGPLAGRVAAGSVPVQPATAEVLQDCRLLGGVGEQGPGGLEGDQEADAPGFAGQRGGGYPRLRAGGQQRTFEPGQLGGLGHLGDVVDVGETIGLAIEAGGRGRCCRGGARGVPRLWRSVDSCGPSVPKGRRQKNSVVMGAPEGEVVRMGTVVQRLCHTWRVACRAGV